MADYLLQEDGSSKFVLEDSSGDILLETQSVTLGFIASATTLYAPSFNAQIVQDFIGSVTAVYAPIAAKPVFFDPISEDFLSNPLEYEGGFGQGYDDFTLEFIPQTDVRPRFIVSVTAVYPPSVPEVNAPFIGSISTLYTPFVGLSNDITVSTPGTYTWTAPAGVTRIYVNAYGGGGGGYDSDGPNQGFSGGGGGAYAEGTLAVTPGTTYTFIVGAAGAAASPGGNGGDSSFVGDSGGQIVAKGGQGGQTGQGPGTGGAGGQASASTGAVKHSGGSGGDGQAGPGTAGSGGGASGNQLADGAAGSLGGGGGSPTGGAGGVGANGGGSGGQGCGYSHNNATPGTAPGGGGGGGSSGIAPNHSSAGAAGQVTVTVGFVIPFIGSTTSVYTPTVPVEPPFIGSVSAVYAPLLPAQLGIAFISSTTIVYAPTVPEVNAPFIASATHVWSIFSRFDPNLTYSGVGNGGESTVIELAPNGTSVTATLSASLGVATGETMLLTGDSGMPTTRPFVATIDAEQVYISPISPGSYRIRSRGLGNTTPASHMAGANVTWGDSYDQAIVATMEIAANFTADIDSSGATTYPGWLICFDCSQAYNGAGARYPMHVTSVLGVFDAGAGSSGTNRCDAAQPNAISTPTGLSDDCPAALSNPSRIQSNISVGDVAVVRFTNPESYPLYLGPRSVSLQSWFGLKRVDSSGTDVTFTDPNGYVVDTHPSGPGPGPFTGSVNGEWDPAPMATGIARDASAIAGHAVSTPNTVPWTTVTLPGTDRYFTYGASFSEKGWPMCCLSVRQGNRRVPFWQSWDWHDFNYVYTGFGTDANYSQILVNRNGLVFGPIPEVDLPGPQDIDGPDAYWDDGSYPFGASWYVVIFNTPYLVLGPPIGGEGPPSHPDTLPLPYVAFASSFTPTVTVPTTIEGGGGGGIGVPGGGLHVWQTA